jgi:hypothetical protein
VLEERSQGAKHRETLHLVPRYRSVGTLERAHRTEAWDEMKRFAMLRALGPLFEHVRPQPGESQAEATLRYAKTHPDEAHAVLHPAAERTIVDTMAQISAAERRAEVPTPSDLERAHRTRARRAKAGVATGNARGTGTKARPVCAGGVPGATSSRGRKQAKPKLHAVGSLGAAGAGANDNNRYGIRWTAHDGRTGWLLRDDKPWSASQAEATEQLRRLRKPDHEAKNATKYEAAPYSAAAERAWQASRPEANVKAPELRNTADIAARIRADIAEAVRRKALPKAKYSVRTSTYSMGSAIDIEASKLPFPVINPDAFFVEPGANFVRFDSAHFRSRFTAAAQKVEAKLEAIVNAYNWNRSDYATDYTNVRFHGDVKLTEDASVWKSMEAAKVAAARAH